ncbi:hypothetical protein IJV79_01425 [bacterium]|nr:hypothetical protein [bacterium]
MKIFQILLLLLITQSACFAYYYHPHTSPFFRQNFPRRGVATGIPTPIVQYNVPNTPTPHFVNQRQIIRDNYRNFYPIETKSSITILDD